MSRSRPSYPRSAQNRVVPRLRPHPAGAARAEVPDEQPHRPARPVQLARRPTAFRLGGEQRSIGVPGIAVRDHDRGGQRPSAAQRDAGDAAFGLADRGDFFAQHQGAALRLDHPRHRRRDRADAADRAVHAEAAFEMGDEDVHRGDVERVAADEQRMEGQGHPQPRIAHPERRVTVHGPVGPEPHKGGDGLQKLDRRMHRPPP